MNKKTVAMIGVGAVLLCAAIGAFLLLRNNDLSRYDGSYVWRADYAQRSQKDVLIRGRSRS